MKPVLLRLLAIITASVCFSLSYIESPPGSTASMVAPTVFLVMWAAATASFHQLPPRYTPTVFSCPLVPWLPSLGALACLHLIGSLGWPAYVRWGIWFVLGCGVYFGYGIHHSQVRYLSSLKQWFEVHHKGLGVSRG